jgi:hypothetical protein
VRLGIDVNFNSTTESTVFFLHFQWQLLVGMYAQMMLWLGGDAFILRVSSAKLTNRRYVCNEEG